MAGCGSGGGANFNHLCRREFAKVAGELLEHGGHVLDLLLAACAAVCVFLAAVLADKIALDGEVAVIKPAHGVKPEEGHDNKECCENRSDHPRKLVLNHSIGKG